MADSGSNVMWRSVPPEALHTIDEQIWPAQPHSLPLPNEVLREASSVSDLTAFFAIGEAWSQMVAHYLPADPRVLDIGCGCGKQARFLYLIPGLTYVGIDLFKPAIAWCEKVFAHTNGRFRFVHFDGHSEVYNPGGKVKAAEYVFPLQDGEIDMTICASLFTHLFEPDARHYLSEIRRTLKPGGQAIISIHINPKKGKRFSGDEARIDIDEGHFQKMCGEAGLTVAERIGVIYGQTAYLLRRD
jgi:SAM-dependent methyltransferase